MPASSARLDGYEVRKSKLSRGRPSTNRCAKRLSSITTGSSTAPTHRKTKMRSRIFAPCVAPRRMEIAMLSAP